MPPRPNVLYRGNGNTYGSRGLVPSAGGGGYMNQVPTALAQVVGTIVDAATYDPKFDPAAQQARYAGAQADKLAAQQRNAEWFAKAAPNPAVQLGDLAANMTGTPPEELAQYDLVLRAARGAQPGQTMDDALSSMAMAQIAAGKPASATLPGSTYNSRYEPTEVMGANGPELVAAQNSYGMAPVLAETEVKGGMLTDLLANDALSVLDKKRAVGATPLSETVLNYTGPNGERGSGTASTIPTGPGYMAFTGQATGTPDQLRPSVRGNLQVQSLANQQFGDMLGLAEEIAVKDPTLFGVAGNTRRLAQNLWQQVANVKQLAPGVGLGDAYRETFVKAAQNGIKLADPTAYDPNLSDIVTIAELLTFGAAEALANQQGRSVSDKDVQMFRSIVGDPTAWGSSQEQFLSKIGLVRDVLGMKQQRIDSALGGVAASAVPGPAPIVSRPGATPQPEDPASQLPPGAEMLPDGRARLPDGTVLRWVP